MPVLKQLHWLRIRQRIAFKVVTTIQKALHSQSSTAYMKELCNLQTPQRALRSSSDEWRLMVPRASNQYGSRSLQVLGARLWNELPVSIRGPSSQTVFKKQLKTVLFRRAFD